MRIIKFFVLGLIFVLLSCQNSEIDYELRVLNDIFIELTGNMYVSKTYPMPPPPPPPILNDNDSIIGYDTTMHNAYMAEYRKELNNLKIDTQNVVLAIFDSLFAYYGNDLKYIKEQLPSDKYLDALNSIENSEKNSVLIDLKDLKKTGVFKLKYASEFPPGRDVWEKKYDFSFSGILYISRIYFDKEKNYGIFNCSFSCGGLCGQGNLICIRKLNGKWIIEKTIGLWIS